MENKSIMPNLYEMAGYYREVAETLANMELDDDTVKDTLDSLAAPLEEKAVNVCIFARNLEATAEAIKEAEAKMAARRKAIENRAKRVREYVKVNMEIAGIKKIEHPYFRLAVRDNPTSVEISDVEKVPAEYMRIPDPSPPAPDKKAIAAAIKAGQEVPGAALVQTTRLEIR